MKNKIIKFFLCFACMITLSSSATESFGGDSVIVDGIQLTKVQKQISEIGFNLLNYNSIDKRMVFYLDVKKEVNAYTRVSDRKIVIYRGLYQQLEDKDEISAVLAHEISHGIDSYNGILRGYFSHLNYVLSPRKYEYKADKRAVDFMVGANYNPVALIVVMNKIFPQRRFDWCSTHPLTTRRIMEVYEYIYKKYPEYLVDNKYKNNIYYQNFLLNTKEDRLKLKNKIETNSNKKIKYN